MRARISWKINQRAFQKTEFPPWRPPPGTLTTFSMNQLKVFLASFNVSTNNATHFPIRKPHSDCHWHPSMGYLICEGRKINFVMYNRFSVYFSDIVTINGREYVQQWRSNHNWHIESITGVQLWKRARRECSCGEYDDSMSGGRGRRGGGVRWDHDSIDNIDSTLRRIKCRARGALRCSKRS